MVIAATLSLGLSTDPPEIEPNYGCYRYGKIYKNFGEATGRRWNEQMERTTANNRIRLLLAMLSVVIVAMLSLGFPAASAEAAIPECPKVKGAEFC